MAMTTLIQPNTVHGEGMDVEGNELITFSCPSCGKSIETRPAATGQSMGALSECRHCSAIFKKTIIGGHAYGVKLGGPSKVSG